MKNSQSNLYAATFLVSQRQLLPVWQVLRSRPLAHLLPPRSRQTPLLWPPGRLYSLTNMALMMEMKGELLTFPPSTCECFRACARALVWGVQPRLPSLSSGVLTCKRNSWRSQQHIIAHPFIFKAIFTGFNPKSSFLRVFVTTLTRAPTQNTPLFGLVHT